MFPIVLSLLMLGANPDLDSLILRLDNNSAAVRMEAYNTLKTMEYQAIPRLKKELETNPSLEVKSACGSLIEYYYQPQYIKNLSIWYLPQEYRYRYHQDIAEEYYMVAIKKLGYKENSEWFNYQIYDAEKLATVLLIEDLLALGKRKECLEIIDCIAGNMQIVKNWDLHRGNFWRAYSNGASKPKSIESVMISMYMHMAIQQEFIKGIKKYAY